MVALEVIVALLRNGGCVLKSVLDPKHWVMLPRFGAVTSLEAFIAPLQGAAVLYNASAAVPFLGSRAAAWLASTAPPMSVPAPLADSRIVAHRLRLVGFASSC